ncbi:MAG TPA: Fic family protein [Gordonia sp. (in: high G+C Gram-positive bacteria)]|nr:MULTISPECIES: Fic family protein [unclassified Gordonia (in: high G+C Gram-positive bacteria)]HRC49393.1 Fic family protein [Gordonia sp. (in: high G+C Gram-positive bacteria)]
MVADFRDRLGGLPKPAQAELIWADIWHREAHHSTALEGNTLVLREVELLLDEGYAVGSRPLKEYMEVRGYADAAKWVYAQAVDPGDWNADGLISLAELRHVHEVAMSPVWQIAPHPEATQKEAPGRFRERDIRPFGGGMKLPPWPLVPARIQDWIDSVNTAVGLTGDSDTPFPEVLARLHVEFERVHPFIDGNGRTGRLLLNLMLVRLGYPPLIILKRQRNAYLSALDRGDNGDYGPLGEILARAMYDSLNSFIVPSLAEPDRLVPLAALVDEEFSIAALRQAAQRGRLDAMQTSDGVWHASKEAVEEYRRTKRRPRKR